MLKPDLGVVALGSRRAIRLMFIEGSLICSICCQSFGIAMRSSVPVSAVPGSLAE